MVVDLFELEGIVPGVADAAAEVPCPFCAEPIQPLAIKCKHCKTFLKGEAGLDPQAIDAAEREIEKLAAGADEPADRTGQPGKFRVMTWIVTALLAASVAWMAWSLKTSPDGDPIVVIPIIMVIAFGLAWMILFFTDLASASPKDRATAAAAVRAYFDAVKLRRWKAAFTCLSPIARSHSEVEIPEISEIASAGGEADFRTPAGLKTYWKSLTHYSGGFGAYRRIVGLGIGEPSPIAPNVERLNVSFSIESYPQWIILTIFGGVIGIVILIVLYFALRKRWEADFDVVAIKHRSQWWLLTGELDSPLDRHVFLASEQAGGTGEGASTVLP